MGCHSKLNCLFELKTFRRLARFEKIMFTQMLCMVKRAVLQRFRDAGLTLRRDKCKLGKPEVMWFGHLYSRLGMRADPSKAQVIKEWPSPRTVKEVKSLLQTLQYNAVYMAAEEGEKSYVELTAPLRYLTKQQVKFNWTEEMEK